MKEKFTQLKEAVGKLGSKTKKIIIAGAVILLIAAVAIAVVLNNRPYEELFSGLGKEEAQQIVTRLQEEGVPYKFKGESTILVEKNILDVTKAKLVQEGYPKSGFTYDIYKDNAGMMATDSDKSTYKLYELQDRIGSTIRLFEGVEDAKVTIALGQESKYALNDKKKEQSSATVVVTTKPGVELTKKQAIGIQRLVAKSVPEMQLEDVAVFDGEGNDISASEKMAADSSEAEEIAKIVEDQIAQKVMRVLGPIYGEDNAKVSARAKINMEKLVRETTTYSTPEKIDEEDKTGIISKEDLYNEKSANGGGAQGVAGTETNGDTAQYNTDGTTNGAQAESESISREYLVNQIKEQGQVDPGVLDDLTVSVAINGNGFGTLDEDQLKSLIANASGITAEDQQAKISVVSAPFYNPDDTTGDTTESAGFKVTPLSIGIIAAAVLALIIVLIIVLLMRKKRRKQEEELEGAELLGEEGEVIPEEMQEEQPYDPIPDLNEEMLSMQNDRGMELKKNIREFADKNPEISAQLLKNWLNGGKDGEQ